jgi:hypothetical protein
MTIAIASSSAPSAFPSSFQNTAERQNVPQLKLRKDIWTHFPVCLIKMPYTDGRDRYAVQWHQKNLSEWSQGIAIYPIVTRLRLMKALNECNKWSVEPSSNCDDICILAMNFTENMDYSDTPTPDLFGPMPSTIQSMEDLRNVLPICWKHKQNRYYVEYHNTQIRALALKNSMSEIQVRQIVKDKLQSLASSMPSWTVHPGTKMSEICQITGSV